MCDTRLDLTETPAPSRLGLRPCPVGFQSAPACQSCLTLCDPMDCGPPGSCPWDSPGKNTRLGCHFLLQGIFSTQGSSLGLLCLLHCTRFFTSEPPKCTCCCCSVASVMSDSVRPPHKCTEARADSPVATPSQAFGYTQKSCNKAELPYSMEEPSRTEYTECRSQRPT